MAPRGSSPLTPEQRVFRMLRLTRSARGVTSFELAIDDPAAGTCWEFKGNAVYKVGGKLVAHLLT